MDRQITVYTSNATKILLRSPSVGILTKLATLGMAGRAPEQGDVVSALLLPVFFAFPLDDPQESVTYSEGSTRRCVISGRESLVSFMLALDLSKAISGGGKRFLKRIREPLRDIGMPKA